MAQPLSPLSPISPSSSGLPSSSAVTIPTPGKSILKRAPPPQPSIFTRFIKILPTQAQTNANTVGDDTKTLRRAHFILPQIATVYPISSMNPPCMPTTKDEKKAIEEKEAERRRRVVRGNSFIGPEKTEDTEEWWAMDKVESFYRECCEGTQELPDPAISVALKKAGGASPRSVDLSGVQLTDASALIVSDLLTIEWGLRKLVMRECDLDDLKLKPILHSLLIPNTLSFLSVASNRRLKPSAFKLIGAYATKATSLRFLDLSQILLDKKSVEYIVAAFQPASAPGLESLRLDDCSLRPAALEVLSHAVRISSLKNISLRHNRINATGAVALAIMIKDYPDAVPGISPSSGTLSVPPSPSTSISSLPSQLQSPPSSPLPAHLPPPPSHPAPTAPGGKPLPPPRHPAATGPQTTYTPYVPRARRGAPVQVHAAPNPLSPNGKPVPVITSSSQGGITARLENAVSDGGGRIERGGVSVTPQKSSASSQQPNHLPSAALLDKVRALDALPRLGALKTLDLKGNDLRTGITYIAQVLKRNRTLKVLNLSENKLDIQCLVSIAEALKYNLCLETLDISKNPCCGPALEGVQSLRTAFTLNTALKRLFLSSTSLTSAGAIALAEFLPESMSLLHLDLTRNSLDIAGVMALSSGLKANHVMRCLDLDIPPGDEEFARMCREILNSCIRNTEDAEKALNTGSGTGSEPSAGEAAAAGKPTGKGVWTMIHDSELAKHIKRKELSENGEGMVVQVQSVVDLLEKASFNDADEELVSRAKDLSPTLTNVIAKTSNPARLQSLLELNDKLTEQLARLEDTPAGRKARIAGLGLQLSTPEISPNPTHENQTTLTAGSPAGVAEEESDAELEAHTPRIDKGKGRAEPEPEEHEKILSPTLIVGGEESEDETRSNDDLIDSEAEEIASPNDRSKSWVEEEGEVFRKGSVLLGPEEMEGEYAGEDLRKELLDAMVERPPPRNITDNLASDQAPLSPKVTSPTTEEPPTVPEGDMVPKKPPLRPYLVRKRSSSSSISTITSAMSQSAITSPLSPKSPGTPTAQNPMSPATITRPFISRSRSSSADLSTS